MRTCITCGCAKDEGDFYRYRYSGGMRFESRCKPCGRERRKGHYKANAEHSKSVARAYKRRNGDALLAKTRQFREENREHWLVQKRAYEQRRRSRASLDTKEAVALVQLVLDEARVRGGWLDAYTGEVISDPEVDHIVPISQGGAHEYENLCVTSGWNNRSKKDRHMLGWLSQRAA